MIRKDKLDFMCGILPFLFLFGKNERSLVFYMKPSCPNVLLHLQGGFIPNEHFSPHVYLSLIRVIN